MKKRRDNPTGGTVADAAIIADTAAEPRATASDKILLAVFLIFICAIFLSYFVIPPRDFSEEENTKLAQLPDFSVSALLSGRFASGLSDYLSDQFPARSFFLSVRAISELSLGKGENNDVILGSGGTLLRREDEAAVGSGADEAAVQNLAYAAELFNALEAQGIETAAAIMPDGIEYGSSRLPALYPRSVLGRTASLTEAAASMMPQTAIVPIADALKISASDADSSDYLYYRTDHHCTTEAAYLTASAIISAFGGEPYPRSDYRAEVLTDSFYGTSAARACLPFIAPDTLTLFRFDGDDAYVTANRDVGGSFMYGFYDFTASDRRDAYSVFLGGNPARADVYLPADPALPIEETTPSPDRETLLIIKDSFAHSAAPFLARRYNLVLVDMRYYNGLISDLAAEIEADKVLLLMSSSTLTQEELLVLLRG